MKFKPRYYLKEMVTPRQETSNRWGWSGFYTQKWVRTLLGLGVGLSYAGVHDVVGSIRTSFSQGASTRVILIVAITFLLLIIVMVINEIRKSDLREKTRALVSWDKFYVQAKECALSSSEINLLEQIIQEAGMNNPDTIFDSSQVFENALEKFYGTQGGVKRLNSDDLDTIRRLRKDLGFLPLPVETPYLSSRQFMPSSRVLVECLEQGTATTSQIVAVDEKMWMVENTFSSSVEIKPEQKLRLSMTRVGDAEYTIIAYVYDVGRHIRLLHTRDLNRRQLRNWVRVDVNFPATVTADDDNSHPLEARVVDLSGGGMALRIAQEFGVGKKLKISFQLDDYVIENIDVDIIRVAPVHQGDETLYQHSVSFGDVDQSVQENIVRFVFEKQRQEAQWK